MSTPTEESYSYGLARNQINLGELVHRQIYPLFVRSDQVELNKGIYALFYMLLFFLIDLGVARADIASV
jgi:hypothetical protein